MIENELARLLQSVRARKTMGFSGLGIIATSKPEKLPISPLRKVDASLKLPASGFENCLSLLVRISNFSNPYHDGFHVLSSRFSLVSVSQFFSTPIVTDILEDYNHGSRFRTALYGSTLPDVLAVGVVSQEYEASIFINGRMIDPDIILMIDK
jgi:hypothetical protein